MTPTPEVLAQIEAELRAGPFDHRFQCFYGDCGQNGQMKCGYCALREALARWVAEREAGLREEVTRLREERDHYREEELPHLRARVAELESDAYQSAAYLAQANKVEQWRSMAEVETRRADNAWAQIAEAQEVILSALGVVGNGEPLARWARVLVTERDALKAEVEVLREAWGVGKSFAEYTLSYAIDERSLLSDWANLRMHSRAALARLDALRAGREGES